MGFLFDWMCSSLVQRGRVSLDSFYRGLFEKSALKFLLQISKWFKARLPVRFGLGLVGLRCMTDIWLRDRAIEPSWSKLAYTIKYDAYIYIYACAIHCHPMSTCLGLETLGKPIGTWFWAWESRDHPGLLSGVLLLVSSLKSEPT